MISLIRRPLSHRLICGEQGAVALIMLLGFIGLAVPLTVASIQTSAQLSRNSGIYDSRMTGMYNAGSGIEVALHELLSDLDFDDGMTPESPDKTIDVESNGESVAVTVSKIFTGESLQGQGLDIKKTVTPSTGSADVLETYTYTITVTNIGVGTSSVTAINDLLPPGFDYKPLTTSGLTTSEPALTVQTGGGDIIYLNDATGTPYSWDETQGNDSAQGTYTPAQGVWETLPEYWEMTFAEDTEVDAADWMQRQWWNTTNKNNKYRFKLQQIDGGVTELFTSGEKKLKENQWKRQDIAYSATSSISLQAADKLRLRLEVYSNEADPADRQFDYRWGGISGYDSLTLTPLGSCGIAYDELTWTIFPPVTLAAGEDATLSFDATATRPDGTYYNQAWVNYDASWDSGSYETRTPATAPIVVGSGQLTCAGGLLVTKAIDPEETDPGVLTTFTYTISVANTMSEDFFPRHIVDLLPPGFTYVNGSASDPAINSGGLWLDEPAKKLQADSGRWHLNWHIHSNAVVPAGTTATHTFQATATLDPGYTYNNSAWTDWKDGVCWSCPPGYDASTTSGDWTLGSGPAAAVQGSALYDLRSVGPDGSVLVRAILSKSQGKVDILSWQEKK
ncbi:MAG: hypothetical protein O7D33_09585 [Chloroflexi bacterium]|nr:hypothetical protein [Chloroflexota bacterium]